MTKIIKNSAIALLGAATLIAQPAKAEQSTGLDLRTKMEYSGNFDDSNTLRETIAFGNEGAYNGRTSIKGQFFDIGRFVSTQDLEQDKSSYMIGTRLNPQSLLEITNNIVPSSALIFGSHSFNGDTSMQSLGSEMNWNFGNNELFLRGEFQNENQSLSHVGGTFRYNLGNWTLQVGGDHVSQDSGDFNQIFGNVSFYPTKNDSYAITFAHQDLSDKTENNRLRFTTAHFGKDVSWGHRSYAEYAWNPKKDQQTFSGQLALVPFGKSTYGKVAARLFSEDTWNNDSAFEVVRTPFAFYTESVPHFDRIFGGRGFEGLGFNINTTLTKNGSLDSSTVSAQAHYIGRTAESQIGQNEYGAFIGTRYFDSGKDVSTYIDAGLTARIGKNLSLRAQFGVPIAIENSQKVQGTLEAEIKF